MSDMDVLIIGAGTAGQTAAYDLVAEGYSVAVVEQSDEPGGVCALHGCQPKKWFYEVTELMARAAHLQGKGVETLPRTSWKQIQREKESFTSEIPGSTVANLKGNGIQYLQGVAKFVGKGSVAVGEAVYHPRFVIVATGAIPMELTFKGSEYLANSNDFLDLEEIPKRITFVGGGFISFEFAHFASRLGSDPGQVRILEAADKPLGGFDEDMAALLVKAGESDGIRVDCSVEILQVKKNGQGYQVILGSGETIETDMVVHGAGREPNLAHLDLDLAGINYSKSGIEVDEQMRSSNSKVFAVGDCAATLQLARVADHEAHYAAATIIAGETHDPAPGIDYRGVPTVLFTYPQLGMVGKTEEQLKAESIPYWKSMDSGLSWPTYKRIGLKHAAYKILIDSDGQILGAHILSDNSTGLINCFKQAMLSEMTVNELYNESIMGPYPSRESDIIYMLDSLRE